MTFDLCSVLTFLGVGDDWDLLLAGDGSGGRLDKPCGWGVVGVLPDGERTALWGGLSHGSIGAAELLPYLHALLWYRGRVKKKVVRAVVVSDSENTVKQGNREYDRKAWAPVWAAIDAMPEYHVRWYWLGRNQLDLNTQADGLSRSARKAVEAIVRSP